MNKCQIQHLTALLSGCNSWFLQVVEICIYATSSDTCHPKPGYHIPSGSCCASAAPDTDSRVCSEPEWLGCVHSAAGPSLSGSVPAASAGALVSSALHDVHPARQGRGQAAKKLPGMSWQFTGKRQSPRTFCVVV